METKGRYMSNSQNQLVRRKMIVGRVRRRRANCHVQSRVSSIAGYRYWRGHDGVTML